uniref:Glucosamine-6-phosphate isomerase n=1 Tax=Kwoniella dejecticola CBS 10117 TaxID=1296121 RepID=A0A1A6AHG9_9TREE|nr:glucosamine-6-phosphate deaminase [Kwoniella dejecticola CBS 10117]OBR89463.1 glucosamine-6-phosphate deaminase [Kwoniella dejecticola CBS 10117]
MYLSTHSTPLEASQEVADLIIDRIKAFGPTQKKKFVMCLPTGSTPLLVYKELAKKCREGKISFEHVITINLDEYVGLHPAHPQSYYHFMEENFDIPPKQVHLLPFQPIPPHTTHTESCAEYESLITSLGGIHLLFMGIGTNGHIAFNEPASSLASRTRMIKLDQDTRRANSRFFENSLSNVPTHALTMGIGTILEAQEIVLLALGDGKAQAVKEALQGGVNHLALDQDQDQAQYQNREPTPESDHNKIHPGNSLEADSYFTNNVMRTDEEHIGKSEEPRFRPNALRGASFDLSASPLCPRERGGYIDKGVNELQISHESAKPEDTRMTLTLKRPGSDSNPHTDDNAQDHTDTDNETGTGTGVSSLTGDNPLVLGNHEHAEVSITDQGDRDLHDLS